MIPTMLFKKKLQQPRLQMQYYQLSWKNCVENLAHFSDSILKLPGKNPDYSSQKPWPISHNFHGSVRSQKLAATTKNEQRRGN